MEFKRFPLICFSTFGTFVDGTTHMSCVYIVRFVHNLFYTKATVDNKNERKK